VTSAGSSSALGRCGYDIIGDVHGHARLLGRLLEALGYRRTSAGGFAHSDRTAVFVGDLVDRGPEIPETIHVVRTMVDTGNAVIVLGNHEFNLLSFLTPNPDQPLTCLRPQSEANLSQHRATLAQLVGKSLGEALDWFRTLPLWLDLHGLRVVHAQWHTPSRDAFEAERPPGRPLDDPLLARMNRHGDSLAEATEQLLKGWEIPLPPGVVRMGEGVIHRDQMRARWYLDPRGQTYRSFSLHSEPVECDEPLATTAVSEGRPYPATDVPVFIGHYGLLATGHSVDGRAAMPTPLASNVACVDWGVAKGGVLAAFRHDGEAVLDAGRFLWVAADGTVGSRA
jgi:hypothetical protein